MPSTRLEIRVQTRASRSEVVVTSDGTLKVYVMAAADGGKANKAVAELLAKRLHIPKRGVTIVSGEKSRTKKIAIEGLDEAEVVARLKQ